MIIRINGCSLKTPYGLDRVADTQFLVQSNLLGLLNTILEDEVVLAQVLVVELADDLDRPALLVEYVFVATSIPSIFNLVCKLANIGDLARRVGSVPGDVAMPVEDPVFGPDLQPRRVAPVPANVEAATDDIVLARNSQLD